MIDDHGSFLSVHRENAIFSLNCRLYDFNDWKGEQSEMLAHAYRRDIRNHAYTITIADTFFSILIEMLPYFTNTNAKTYINK
jgi:hypothetical protein